MTIHEILKKYWGFAEFRPLQQDIIQAVLDKKDILALLPTGGGKSICFQVPALAQEGICIVVSPLIALMKDQVTNLRKKGIKAHAIFSGMSYREIDIALDNCVHGNYKFLYVSPERLQTELFIERVKRMNVNLIAVDEAHCISQWGYDFRPSYLQIANLRELLPQVPVLALSATATEKVVKDIQEKLVFNSKFPFPLKEEQAGNIKKKEIKERNDQVIRKSFFRSNLSYSVLQEDDKLAKLLKIISRIKGSGIVYVRNRKKAQNISDYLNKNKVSASFYHAGLEAKTRDECQEAWIKNKVKVIVCTNAFGMGIDKPDVRFVIHMDIPDSPEAYFQEAGRAGRDEQKAYAIILYQLADIHTLKEQIQIAFPPGDLIKSTYRALGNYLRLAIGSGKDQSFLFNLYDFCQSYKLDLISAFNALKILEKAGYILMSESVYIPSRIHFNVTKDVLFKFQVAHPHYDIVIKTILRAYAGLFDEYIKINEVDIAKRCQLTIEQVKEVLTRMAKSEIVSYLPQIDSPRLTYLQARMDHQHINISKEVIENRKTQYEHRVTTMIRYVSSPFKCRSEFLLSYFDEIQTKPCGICDVCREYHSDKPTTTEYNAIYTCVKKILSHQPMELKSLVNAVQLAGISEKKILKTLDWLKENEVILMNADHKFILKI